MNPLSSITPGSSVETSSSLPKGTVLSSPDGSNEVSALAPNPVKGEGQSPSAPTLAVTSYLERMSQIPDVRQVKIAEIQTAIDSQSYTVSAEKLADSLIQELHPHSQGTRPPTTL